MKEVFRTIVVFILTLEARAVLKKYAPRIIVVTGSVGKTSTKDALYEALSQQLYVRKSEKSFNSDIGVPLTILGLPNGWDSIGKWIQNIIDGLLLILIRAPFPQWLIVEVGADRPGDISQKLNWLTPDIVVTTTLPDVPVHVEFYDSPEAVVEEELAPLSFLKEGGIAVVNKDDENTMRRLENYSHTTVSYGFDKDAHVRALRYRVTSKKNTPTGISFDVSHGDEKIHIAREGVVGKTHAYALLAAVATATATNTSLEKLSFNPLGEMPNGRLRIIEGKKGTLIDDTYNASPVAAREAVDALSTAPTKGKRVFVIGDMMELGDFSKQEHEQIGVYAKDKVDTLITVGVRARATARAALGAGMPQSEVHSFEKRDDAVSHLLNSLQKEDVVLVKGSQSMRLERVVKALMAHPERAGELLVRQDAEWLQR